MITKSDIEKAKARAKAEFVEMKSPYQNPQYIVHHKVGFIDAMRMYEQILNDILGEQIQ